MTLAIVTGASRGIGRAIFDQFLSDKKFDKVMGIAREWKSADKSSTSDKSILLEADLTTETGIESVRNAIANAGNKVAVLVNNAGSVISGPFTEITLEKLESQYRLHLFSQLLITNTAIENKVDEPLNVINIGSVYGGIAEPWIAPYSLSKAPIPLLTQLLATQFGEDIRVNAILPGHIDTEMTRSSPKEFIDRVLELTPQNKIGTSDDVVNMVQFLISTRSSFVNGTTITLDGGFSASPKTM
jgi:NAD(P)-dependent dehydrogenase (short-subunit alcohol dehydrogenase family)